MANVSLDICVKLRLEICFKLLKKYSWLLDSYVLDYFTENHNERLPKNFKLLRSVKLEEFTYLLNFSSNKARNVWPLSLLSLRVLMHYLSLPREMLGNNLTNYTFLQSNKVDVMQLSLGSVNKKEYPFFNHKVLQNLFLKHVKPKKRYEIFKMAKVTEEVSNKLGVDYVVDVGSGLGHLSRLMAYGFNLNVCSIETQLQLTKQAEKLDSQLETVANKYLSKTEFTCLKSKRPVYLNHTIRFDLKPEEFVKSLKSAFSVNDNFKFGIVGLHPCGDLASVLLKFYSECPSAKFINLVGCCYHKLTTSCETKNDIGFPLTKFCAEKGTHISYEARALACHAIETYHNRLESKNYDHLKVHCFRATLEKIIQNKWPEHRKTALQNVKSAPELSFEEYCRIALKKLHLSVSKEDIELEETSRNLLNWQEVVKFYTLRLMMAPLVETVILLDRKLFLLERGFQCKIIAAFDPQISPRNHLLLSEKAF